MKFYQHPAAIVESSKIGEGTKIWAFAHVLPGAVIGSDCNICDNNFIENDVVIGDRVTIKGGVQVWDGVTIEDDVFIGSNVTFTNDPFPRSKQRPAKYARTLVRKGASIGANATILPGIEIGANAMVGAGAVVVHDVPPSAIVMGNPAFIKGYVDQAKSSPSTPRSPGSAIVKGVHFHDMPLITDLRGKLSYGECPKHLPFIPKRYFITFDVPSEDVRGRHAHKELHQFLVCLKGSCSVLVDDGVAREEILLDSPEVGLYIKPMIWVEHYKYSNNAVLLVLASDVYKADDYIRGYDEFIAASKHK